MTNIVDTQKAPSRYKKPLEDLFPYKDGVDYSKLKMTEEGYYSMTRKKDGYDILEGLRKKLGDLSKLSICDLTANVGGDTIMFGLNFKKVDAIEINKENFEVLKNNITVYELKNIVLHNEDSTEYFDWKCDVVYFDPPWGGPDYKEKNNIDLYLSDIRIDKLVDKFLKLCKWLFIKVPHNYNLSRFIDMPYKYELYDMKKFKLLVLY